MGTIFSYYPMLAGHVSSVRNKGDYILSDWSKRPYVIIRGDDGKIRAFLNTCRHRGARLVDGHEKCLKAFICPFHGWTYRLDGSLKGVTQSYNFPGLNHEDFRLVELPIIEHAGLLWIHPRPGSHINITDYLGPISEDFEHFKLQDLLSYRKARVVKKANWKLLIKTYLEGYHVPYLHRDTLSKAFRGGVISHDEHRPHIRLMAARSNFPEIHKYPEERWNILNYASVYYSLFANAFFIMHPDYVSINMFYPVTPGETIWTHEMLYREDDYTEEKREAALSKRFDFTNDAVFDQEDFAVAENVQAGLVYGGNEFHTLGLEEGLLDVFQRNIDAAIGAGAPTD